MSITNNANVASVHHLIYLVKKQQFIASSVKHLKWLMFCTKHVCVGATFVPYLIFPVKLYQYAAQSANNNQWSTLYLDFANVVLVNYRPIMKLGKKKGSAVLTVKLQQWLMFIIINVPAEQEQISMSLMKLRAFVV